MQASITVTAEEDLPEHYLMAILKMRHHLREAMKSPIYSLKIACLASPPMRSHFMRQPSRNAFDTKIFIFSKSGVKPSLAEHKALWLKGVLWEDGFSRLCLQESNIVDELQRLMDSEPTVKATISSYVAEHFADLAIICECLRQLDTYQPWASSFDHLVVVKELQKELDADFDRYHAPVVKYRAALAPQSTLLVEFGVPHEKLFRYPVDKRRSRINVEQTQTAEKNLDLLLAKLDKSMSKELDGLEPLRALLSEPRAIVRTGPWVEPAEASKDFKQAPMEGLVKPFSDIYLDLQYRTEQTLRQDSSLRSALRTKEKTRGPSADESTETMAELDATPVPPPRTFAVDDRALKTFRMLFFIPSTTNTPGEVSWTDFLQAMISVGFSATKMYGSAWQLQPSNLDVKCSIHFHEPHPSGKIPFRVARRHGRCLQRTYGWEASSFVSKR
jgi:hypothetical protein